MTVIPEPRSPSTPNKMSVVLKDITSIGLPCNHCHAMVSCSEYTVTRERKYYLGIMAGWAQ
jgi:hypothetical protein